MGAFPTVGKVHGAYLILLRMRMRLARLRLLHNPTAWEEAGKETEKLQNNTNLHIKY